MFLWALELPLGLEATSIGSLASHLQENELADLGARDELERLVGSIENFKYLPVVDSGVHESRSDVDEQSKAGKS